MGALSGQLKAIQTQFGKKGVQKMTPKENLANIRAMMKQYGSQGLDEFNKPKTATEANPSNPSGQTPNGTTAQKPDSGGVVNNTSAGSLGTSSSQIQNRQTLQAQEQSKNAGNSSTSNNTGTTTTTKDGEGPGHWEEQTLPDPPAGIMPGTPAYDAWKKDWETKNPRKWISEAPAPGSGPITDETPGAKGITFAAGKGPMKRWAGGGFTISPEQLAGMPPEAQQELRDLAAKGANSQQLSQFRMKYWGEPWAQGLMKSALQNANPGALAKGALSNARGGGWGGAGNTGVKWMDNKYWNNIDAAAAEEEAPPPPASGGGVWEQGPQGPIWNPNPGQGQIPSIPPAPPSGPIYGEDSGFPGSGPIYSHTGPSEYSSGWPGGPPFWAYQQTPLTGSPSGGFNPQDNPYTMWMQQQFQSRYGG